jgi:hypothetical protein
MKSLSARLAMLVPITVAVLLGALVAPAQATLPTGPGGDSCGLYTSHDDLPSAKKVIITLQMVCVGRVSAIEHNVTYQRDGKVVGIKHTYDGCVNRNNVSPFVCTISYTTADPAGSQYFETLDEWVVYFGWDGSTKKKGTTFGTPFRT